MEAMGVSFEIDPMEPSMGPYTYWGRCRRFPRLPRWWWTGMHGSITPWTAPYDMPSLPKGQEIATLEDEVKFLEQQLQEAKRRLEELRG